MISISKIDIKEVQSSKALQSRINELIDMVNMLLEEKDEDEGLLGDLDALDKAKIEVLILEAKEKAKAEAEAKAKADEEAKAKADAVEAVRLEKIRIEDEKLRKEAEAKVLSEKGEEVMQPANANKMGGAK